MLCTLLLYLLLLLMLLQQQLLLLLLRLLQRLAHLLVAVPELMQLAKQRCTLNTAASSSSSSRIPICYTGTPC